MTTYINGVPVAAAPAAHQATHQKDAADALSGTIAVTVVEVGDVVFANNWRLTEVEDGIALLDDKGKIIRRWENA